MIVLIGVIPSGSKSYEVYGDFSETNPVEGKLYYDPTTSRLFYYSTFENRSNPKTGYFPVWDGKRVYISTHSAAKYFDRDAIKVDFNSISKQISGSVADEIRYKQRRAVADDILKPPIQDGDNAFTQCVKGVISALNITMVDLVDMCKPKLDQKVLEGYYNALSKITFMRIDKWNIWVNNILHIQYTVNVYKDGKRIVQYNYPENTFDTGIVKYTDIIKTKEDPLKKIVKILMVMCNITKKMLLSSGVDDYTVNNMMTTINSEKALSAQLFSRFIRLSELSYDIQICDNGKKFLFEYKE